MEVTDKMCHDVANKIINDIFLVKYVPTIKQAGREEEAQAKCALPVR